MKSSLADHDINQLVGHDDHFTDVLAFRKATDFGVCQGRGFYGFPAGVHSDINLRPHLTVHLYGHGHAGAGQGCLVHLGPGGVDNRLAVA